MTWRFRLRELLGYVTLAAFASALFVYLPVWNAIFLALLIASAIPLSNLRSERLEAIVWCLGAAMICYHLGLLLSVNRQPMAYALPCVSWAATVGYGLRKQNRLRNRIWTAGLAGMMVAFIFVPEFWGGDLSLIEHERPHWFVISFITSIASCLPIAAPYQKNET